MQYNIFIQTNWHLNILDINEQELVKVIDCYNKGNKTLWIQGEKYNLNYLCQIRIFTFEHPTITTKQELLSVCKTKKLMEYSCLEKPWLPIEILEKVGKDVTDEFITDDYGWQKEDEIENECFVDRTRIEELSQIDNSDFDYTKLIELLEELNGAYANENYFSVASLLRSIIDHVPPIFGKENFGAVCGGYGLKSFQESMKHLNESARKIADSYLHTQIREKENLPKKIQVDFRQDLDVLLQEIVRINK